MALDFNNNLANALLDRFDTELPATAVLEIRTGAAPGAENAATGTLLVSFTLAASPWLAAAAGVKDIDANLTATAAASGTAAHFRLKNAAGTRIIEGTVGTSAADLILDNTSINSGQQVTITALAFTLV